MILNLPTDRLHKFLTVLGLTLIVSMFTINSNKKDKFLNAQEVTQQKSDSIINGYITQTLMTQAKIDVDKNNDKLDSFKFSYMSDDSLLKYNRLKMDDITYNSDLHILEQAKFKALMEMKERELKALQKRVSILREDLINWKGIFVLLNLLGTILFIIGISYWFSNDYPVV